jgi:hypothetical protein
VSAEVVVALTDYGLALECAVLARLLWRDRGRPTRARAWFALFFGATGLAALLGGTFHGFVPDEHTAAGGLLWRATLFGIGLAAAAAWQVGGDLVLSRGAARWVSIAATVELLGYSAVVILVTPRFSLAIANYLPAALFLLGAFVILYRRTGARPVLQGAVGLVLSVLAAGIQYAGVGLHPVYFNHNALYHLIQAAALLLLFHGARTVCRGQAAIGAPPTLPTLPAGPGRARSRPTQRGRAPSQTRWQAMPWR